MLHRGKRGGYGRPPLNRGGRPTTTTTGKNNNNRSNEESSIDTPPRSPSEGSVTSQGTTLQQFFGSAASPKHSPVPPANNNARIEPVSDQLRPSTTLSPAPLKQPLSTTPLLPNTSSVPKVPTPTPNRVSNTNQSIAAPPKAANVARIGPDHQGLNTLHDAP
jgi:hypothetical protein